MNDLKKEYNKIKEQNETELDLYQKMKKKEYESCKHILVYSEIEHDMLEGRTYRRCGCIKCGLNESASSGYRNFLPFSQKIMYDYISEHYLNGYIRDGIETKIACDLDLAQALYSKIKENHPDIEDDIVIKYFEIALDNIRNIKVSEERKVNRAKRLSLNPQFKNWNARDIHHD